MATPWTLGGDATDPHRLAEFWKLALGYVDEPGFDEPDCASIVDPDGKLPVISWLRVPEGKTAKNRLHLDIRVARDIQGAGNPPSAQRIRDKVGELEAAGATVVREEYYAPDLLGHVTMLDPEGNEFCVG